MASKNLSPSIRHATIIFENDEHSSIISRELQNFYKNNEFFDTVLIAGNKCVQIEAHRVVLCAFSEYFLELFREKQKLSKENVVELKEIEALPLKNVIDFMYEGSIDLTIENVEGILRTVSFLKMRQLLDNCCEMIRKYINSDNFLMFIRLANELDLDQLKNECLEGMFIHFEKISKRKIQNISFKDLDIYDLYRAKCVDDDRKGVQSLDLDTLEWIDLPPMNKSRIWPKLAHLNGHLCVFGAESGQNTGFDQKSASIEIYNFSKQKWHDLEPISQPSHVSEMACYNGMLYIIDFENGFLQSYDVSSNKWTSKSIAKDPRLCNFGFAATKEFLYVYGGCYLMYCDIEYINKVKRFDLRNNYNCCEMKPFPFRRCLNESFVIKKHIIICDSEKVDIYDIEKDEWESLEGELSKNEWSSCAFAYLNL